LLEAGHCLIRSARLRPDVHHDLLEAALVLQAAHDHVHLADDQFKHIQLAVEDLQDIILNRALGREIEYLHRAGLADAVDASDALLDALRVPGQVEVEHETAELEVAPLARRLGREQHLGALLKAVDGLVLLRP